MATQPSGNLGRMDPIASVRYCKRWFTEERAGWLENRDVQRLWEHLDVTMRAAQHAEKVLRTTNVNDDDAVDGMTALIDEVSRKHDGVRNEMASHGVTVPIAPTTDISQSLGGGQGGRRMGFERQIGDIKEACVQLREMMEYQQNRDEYDGLEDAANSSSGGDARRATYRPEGESSELSGANGHGDDDDSDDDDQAVMTPRGVYVQRCLPLTKGEIAQEMEGYQSWIRLTKIDLIGLAIFLVYLVASLVYLAARCYYSLDGLGNQLWYGAIVLAAEMMSVLSLIFYGIWLCAKTNNDDMKVKDFDSDKMRRLYVIRVFILCKDESLSLVRRTIASIKNAYLPDGCEVKLYLLDENRDNVKRDFFMGMKTGTDVIYITPPVRSESTKPVNWRSEIMNFTLTLIYPAPSETGFKNISVSELVCVVTADQTCSSSFFANLLRFIDSGDDIAAAICPRIAYNVDGDCDIFDHQKVAYCERMQLGMDAYGFTACMHTNMLLRARALQEIGWFPTHTKSENWELGMLLRSYGWKSRYVPEYSAIGEAPEEICESFDAHYSNSRGYFQTFWSYNCPLLNRDLGVFYRLMYASRCFQNFASGIWTFIFTCVPIIHLIAGYFPVTFTIQVVITMMTYYAIRTIMLLYCDSFKQMRALWFSRIATSINWWVDCKAAFLIPTKAAIGPGTSFRSRTWSYSVPARNLKSLVWPVFFILASIVAFIGGCIHLRKVINLPIVLSLCLVIVNIAPPLLVAMHWNFGQGTLLTRCASVMMLLSFVAGTAALVFLWVLYPREVDYDRAADLSLEFLNAQRSGKLRQGFPIDWRFDSGLQYTGVQATWYNESANTYATKAVDLSGGFYNDGDVGPVKLTWNIALTTSMLAWSMLEYPEYWAADVERKNLVASVLRHGAAYISETYVVNPLRNPLDPERAAQSSYDLLYYVVGNMKNEHKEWNRPEDVKDPTFVGYVALEESPSDLGGQVVAALVSSALALLEYDITDRSQATDMVNHAHRLFYSAMASPGLYTEAMFDNSTVLSGTGHVSENTDIEEYYPSSAFGDDLFWASTWLFRAASNNVRAFNITYYKEAMTATMDIAYGELDMPGVGWDYMNNLAVTHAATITRDIRFHLAAQSFIWDWICDDELVKYTRNGRAYFFQTPHLGSTAGAAAMAALYVKASKDWYFVEEKPALIKGFQCFATEQARYLLGGQVTGIRQHRPFMIGYNSKTFTRTWHRGASCPAWNDLCDISVNINDAPDQNEISGALLWNPIFEDFPLDVRGRNTTVVSLENNFAVPMLFAAVAQQKVSFSECMNAKGTAFVKPSICRKGRPQDDRLGPREAIGQVAPEFEGLYKPREKEDDRIPPPPPPELTPLV